MPNPFDQFVDGPAVAAAPENPFEQFVTEGAAANPFDQFTQPAPVPQDPDELWIGQEVRGVGRALKRGGLRLRQAGSTLASEFSRIGIEPFTAKVSELNKELERVDKMTPDEQARLPRWKLGSSYRDDLVNAIKLHSDLLEGAKKDTKEGIRSAVKLEARAQNIPGSPDLANLQTDFWGTFARNPVETIATVMAESLPQMAPAMIGGAVTGGAAVPVLAGLNSFAVEYAGSLLDSARDAKVDLTDPDQAEAFFNDPKLLSAARVKAVKRGLPVSAFDTATAGLAGRFLKPALGQGAKQVAIASGKELLMQMAGGASGEAGGQLASEGRITSVPDIAMEALAEIGSAPAEVYGNIKEDIHARNNRPMQGPPLPPRARIIPSDWLESGVDQTIPATSSPSPVDAAIENGSRINPFDRFVDTDAGLLSRPIGGAGFSPVDQALGSGPFRWSIPQMPSADLESGAASQVLPSGITPVDQRVNDEILMRSGPRGPVDPGIDDLLRRTARAPLADEPAPIVPAAQVDMSPRRLLLPETVPAEESLQPSGPVVGPTQTIALPAGRTPGNLLRAGVDQAPGQSTSVPGMPPWLAPNPVAPAVQSATPVADGAGAGTETITGQDARTGAAIPAELPSGSTPPPSLTPAGSVTGGKSSEVLAAETAVEDAKAKLKARGPYARVRTDNARKLYFRAKRAVSRAQAALEEVVRVEKEGPKPPVTEPARKTRKSTRPPDLIDAIEESFGKISLSEVRRLQPDFKPVGAARRVFTATGNRADVAADAMAREGMYKGDPSHIVEFAEAINEAARMRKSTAGSATADEAALIENIRQRDQFEAKVLRGERPKVDANKVEVVDVGSLVQGDRFKVQGAEFTVQSIEWDENLEHPISITVKDGPKYGVQVIEPDNTQVIHIDKRSLKKPKGTGEFLPKDEAAAMAKERKAAAKAEKAARKAASEEPVMDAALSADEASVLAGLDGAAPDSPGGRLSAFLAGPLDQVADAAVAKWAPAVANAFDYVRARLFRDAIRYLKDTGDFAVAKGMFGAQKVADWFAMNAAKQANNQKTKDTMGEVSLDAQSETDSESTIGQNVASDTADPRQAAVTAEREEKLGHALSKILDTVQAKYAAEGVGNAFMSVALDQAGLEVPKGVKLSVAERIAANDPAFKRRAMADIREMMERSMGSLDQIRETLYSRINPTGQSIGREGVRAAAEEFLGGKLPSNIVILDQPDWLTPDGKRWDARVSLSPSGWRIELNAPHLTSPEQVRAALLHEAVHIVWEDPSIQAAKQEVIDALGGTEGTGVTAEERLEEAVTSSVTDQWKSEEAKSAWRKLVDRIWAAIKKHLGFPEPESKAAKDFIAAAAVQALRGDRQSNNGREIVRYSRYHQIFRKAADVTQALNVPGLSPDQEDQIKSAAATTGALISPRQQTRLQTLAASPDPVDKATAKVLGFFSRIGELASTPGTVGGTDIGARSTLEADRYANHRIVGIRRELEVARRKMAEIAGLIPKAGQKEIEALIANSNASQLISGYRDYLAAEKKLVGPNTSLGAQRTALISKAELELGSMVRDQPASVGAALESIARNMPAGIGNVPADLHAWLVAQKASGFPAFGGTQPMSDTIWKFMVEGDPGANLAPAILNTPNLMGRLIDLRAIQNDATRAKQVRDRFTNWMTQLTNRTTSNVSAERFAREYSKWVQAHKAAADEASAIFDKLDRIDVRVRSLIRALDVSEQIQLDPQYRAGLTAASDQLDQRYAGIIRFPEGSDGRATGHIQVDGPQSGNAFDFDMNPSKESTDRNVANARSLLAEINTYLARPDAEPGRARVYRERVLPMIEGRFLSDIGSQILGAQDTPHLPVIGPNWLFQLPFRAGASALNLLSHFMPGITPRNLVYKMVPGQAGRMLLEYMGRTDIAHNAIRNAENATGHSSTTQKRLAIAAAKAHGFMKAGRIHMGTAGRSAAEDIIDWSEIVLNQLYARNQNPGGAPLRVGDWTATGRQITAADLDAAKAQKGYTDYIHKALSATAQALTGILPVQTESDGYFRNAVNYGLKMARGESHWGKDFARRWDEARLLDEEQSKGKTAPVYTNREALLRDNPRDFNLAVNGWWGTTNPEYWSGYSDPVQQSIANDRAAQRNTRGTFDDLDEFLDHFGVERESRINAKAGSNVTSEAEERQNAFERLMLDMDTATRKVLRGTESPELPSRDAEGVGDAVASTASARSSLTNPRGRMVAPDTFYEYAITDDGARLRFNSQAMLYYQKQELDALRVVLAGLRRERDRLDTEHEKLMAGMGIKDRLMNEWQYRKNQSRLVRQGESITRRNDLTEIINVLENTAKGIENNMRSGDLDQNRLLQGMRGVEALVSVGKLFSLPVQYANILSAAYLQPILNAYTINQGRLGLIEALTRTGPVSVRLGKEFYRGFADLADQMGVGNVVRKNPAAWMGLAQNIHDTALRRRADLQYLRNAGFGVPETWSEAASRAALGHELPETGGIVVHDNRTHPILNPIAGMVRLLSIPVHALSFSGGQATAAGEMIGVMVQDSLNTQFMESLKPAIIRAFDARARGGPGWNDTSKPLAPFTPQDLGLNTYKALNEVRRQFATAGGLENLFLDFYNRAKAAGPSGMAEPLLPEALDRAVRLEMQKDGNIVTDSAKGDALKKKGWAGLASSILFRFQQYPVMLTEFIRQSLDVDPRDVGAKHELMQAAAAMVLLASLGALATAGLGGRQWLTEVASGKVPAVTTMRTFGNDPNALNFAKMMLAGGGNLFMPYWGDQLQKLIGGQSQRPGMDLAQIVPSIGAAMQVATALQQGVQTRSPVLPMANLTRQLFPASEAILNRLPGLREDLIAQNAARSIRSAAPADLELKDAGGGGNSKATAATPLIRDAIRAALRGDKESFDVAVDKAVQVKMDLGATDESAARKSVIASLRGRDPIRLAVGRSLTADEDARLQGGMSASQKDAFGKSKQAFGRIAEWTKTPKAAKGSSRFGRGRSKTKTRVKVSGRNRRKRNRRNAKIRMAL